MHVKSYIAMMTACISSSLPVKHVFRNTGLELKGSGSEHSLAICSSSGSEVPTFSDTVDVPTELCCFSVLSGM